MEIQVREVSLKYKRTKQLTVKVTSPEDLVPLIHKTLPDNVREHFLVFHLDGANQVVSSRVVSTGTSNETHARPSDVFQAAIIIGAESIIIAHNHPSGLVDPSDADRAVTRRLKAAGGVLGIKVLDHIIVADNNFYSFKSGGEL